MPILIDGHNLIGAGVFDDISLSDEDDEAKLVARLRVWKSRYRGRMTVIFDRGLPGGTNQDLSGAGVEVVFAADPAQADDLIRRRLRRAAHNLLLVTNDDALVREARRYGVETCNGVEFVARFTQVDASKLGPDTDPDLALSEEEVEEWLKLFGEKKRKRRPKRVQGASRQKSGQQRKRRRTARAKRNQGKEGRAKRKADDKGKRKA